MRTTDKHLYGIAETIKENKMTSLEFSADDLSILLSKIYFVPVNVKHGRKFRGFGYVVSSFVADNGGYSNSGVRPLMFHHVYKVWDPATKTYGYFNGGSSKRGGGYSERPLEHEDGVTQPPVSESILIPALLDYLEGILTACKRRCGNDLVWRRNYLRMVLTDSPEALDILCTAIEHARTAEDPGNREERLLAEREYLADMQKNAR